MTASPIAALTPTVTGSVTSYTAQPALPAGLFINAMSGQISGTPTSVTPQATYTITASNSAGSTSFGLVLAVNLAPPSALTYASPTVVIAGAAMPPLSPTVTGAVASYSVDPDLPAGLSLDPMTGSITGTATAMTAQATYTVTGTNAAGSTSFAFVLTVNPAPPTNLSYGVPGTLLIGLPIAFPPTVTSVVDNYSVTPALPPGVSLDTSTGQIAGTPTTPLAASSYTITAQNVSGSTTFAAQFDVVNLVFEARADVGAVDLSWPTGSGASFNLFRAETPGCDTANYASCVGGTVVMDISSPYRQTGLQNGTSYWFRLEAQTSASLLSNEASARPDQLSAQSVNAVAVASDGTVYLGGEFRSVGIRTGSGVPVDATTGLPGAFPFVDGPVFAAVADGADGWYIGGDFQSVGGLPRRRLAHVRPDMTVGDWNPQIGTDLEGGSVAQLAVVGNTIYVAGGFFSINGTARNGFAAIDSAGGLLPLNPILDAYVHRFVVAGDTIYLAGPFSTVQGQPRARLAAIGLDGTLRDWNPGTDGDVWGLAVANGVVYIGGQFTMLGGTPRSNLGAVGANDGVLVQSWNPAPNAWLNGLALDGAEIYIAGGFSQIGGQPRQFVAAVGTDGVVRAWNPTPNAAERIFVAGDVVYIVGQFTAVGGVPRKGVAAVGKDGALRSFSPNPDGVPYTVAASGDNVFIGGWFTHLRGTARTRLAAVHPDGSLSDWAPEADASVEAIAVNGDTVLAGGQFGVVRASNQGSIAGRTRLAAFGTDGSVRTWSAHADAPVRAILAHDGTYYVGGEFTTLAGMPRERVAAIGADGTLSATWNPGADGIVRALETTGDAVFVGGDFAQLAGQNRARLGLVGVDGVLRPWSAALNQSVRAVAFAANTVYVGGDFVIGAPDQRQGLAAFDLNGAVTGWNPGLIGYVHGVAVTDGVVYFTGAFTQVFSQGRRFVAAIGVDGILRDWKASALDQNSRAIIATSGGVHVGGNYHVVPITP